MFDGEVHEPGHPEWFRALDQCSKDALRDMVADAVGHYGTLGPDAIQDVITKFQGSIDAEKVCAIHGGFDNTSGPPGNGVSLHDLLTSPRFKNKNVLAICNDPSSSDPLEQVVAKLVDPGGPWKIKPSISVTAPSDDVAAITGVSLQSLNDRNIRWSSGVTSQCQVEMDDADEYAEFDQARHVVDTAIRSKMYLSTFSPGVMSVITNTHGGLVALFDAIDKPLPVSTRTVNIPLRFKATDPFQS